MDGTIDAFMDGSHAAWFLDRMLHVWVAHTEQAELFTCSLLYPSPGACKRADPCMSNTSRDLALGEYRQHDVLEGGTDSREGAVDCQ